MQKPFKGIIIEESLQNNAALKNVRITATKVEEVTPKHKTPHLKQWTLHTVEIAANQADQAAEALSDTLRSNKPHDNWYADFRNPTTHYIIFPHKIFVVDRSHPEQYQAVKAYGVTLGIPDYQLTFSSEMAEL